MAYNFSPASEKQYAYLVCHDHIKGEEEIIYGIFKIPTKGVLNRITVKFYNDTTGEIGVSAYEVLQSEWETMKAFELFPILQPYKELETCHTDHATLDTFTTLTYGVRFRDN
jgi:hypothetical protein